MSNATTIVPIGNFTPALSRRVREMAIERAQGRAVVISMQSTQRYCWSALYDLAEALRATMTPYPIRLARALPRTRALLHELGIQREWFVDTNARALPANIRIRENWTLLALRFARARRHFAPSRTHRFGHRAKPEANRLDARFVWRTCESPKN
jgi:hypothetical protein